MGCEASSAHNKNVGVKLLLNLFRPIRRNDLPISCQTHEHWTRLVHRVSYPGCNGSVSIIRRAEMQGGLHKDHYPLLWDKNVPAVDVHVNGLAEEHGC